MAGKWKRKLKKLAKVAGKAALIGGALYGATRLGRKRPSVEDVAATEDINIGTRAGIFPPRSKKVIASQDFDKNFVPWPGKKGGRAGKKDGGRTGKQFGGGLNRPVARPVGGVGGVGGVGAPVRPLAYKHGGKVKSMGAAKRGGGVAKK